MDKAGKVLAKKLESLITEEMVKKLKTKDIESAVIRSVLNCKMHKGICAKCYGVDLAYNKDG
jgi:translation elongation factor EF-4